MGKPNPTKRLPNTKLADLVMVRDENEENLLLAFENDAAASLFEACLGDSGYGSAYGAYEVERVNMDLFRQTEAYKAWRAEGQRVVSLAYVGYVADRMDGESFDMMDVSSDLLNCDTVGDAYTGELSEEDFELLFPED